MNVQQIIKEEVVKVLKEQTAIVNNHIVSYEDDDELEIIKKDDAVKSIKKVDGTVIKEMAGKPSIHYSLKPNHEEKLKKYIVRTKKDSIITIVTKLTELLKIKPNQTVMDLFTQIREIYKGQVDILAKVKNHQNIKYYLWGGLTSDKFNARYLDVKDPVTGINYTKGNLNAIDWTPFSRTKDAKELDDFEKSKILKISNPEEFEKIAQNRKKNANPITDAVIEYKILRGKYFKHKNGKDASSQNHFPVIQGKMNDLLNIDVAVAILYQWDKEYITLPLDNPLKIFGERNGLTDGMKSPQLTSKYKTTLNQLIKDKKVVSLG